jgi:5-formyltetrahydrofolate cyclo-ligase
MADSIQEAKRALRQQIRDRLAVLPEMHRNVASAQARSLLVQQPVWKLASRVLMFAPASLELDIWPLVENALSAAKTVALPRFIRTANRYTACEIKDPLTDLQLGQFGIREPAEHCVDLTISRLDLLLVPGVAFDLHGRRLGRGKGFYDQLLAVASGTTCGVAFDEQIVKEIPVEPHDIFVDCILTPTRWLERPPRGLE